MRKQKLGRLQKSWVEALRSKRFKQTSGRLFRPSAVRRGASIPNCCLGVACCVAATAGKWDDEWMNRQTLPDEVVELMKFRDEWGGPFDGPWEDYGFHNGGRSYESLSDANDCGESFARIADFIESYPEMIFTGPA